MTSPGDEGPIFLSLIDRLDSAGVAYSVSRHQAVYTSAEAAAARGVALHSGAKALILKLKDQFVMVALPADLSLDSKAIKKQLGTKSCRFANREEVAHITSLTPGAIPPFGSLFGLATYCDQALADNQDINFNAGVHTVSVSIAFEDYVSVENPTLGRFAAPLQKREDTKPRSIE